MKFEVDVGESYEKGGRVVDINAATPQEALKLANKQCEGEEFVQQIFDEKNRCYYDYMNGFGIYGPDEK